MLVISSDSSKRNVSAWPVTTFRVVVEGLGDLGNLR